MPFSTCSNTLDPYTECEAPSVVVRSLQEFKEWANTGKRHIDRNSNGMGLCYPQPRTVGNVIAGSLVPAFPGHQLMAKAAESTLGWIGF